MADMQDENKKNAPYAPGKKDRERDDFWNMDLVLPKRPPEASSEVRDTGTVEVEVGEENLSAFAPVKQESVRIPPMPSAAARRETSAARKAVEEKFAESIIGGRSSRIMTAAELAEERNTVDQGPVPAASARDGNWHTPGDVRPQMSVPVSSYSPEGSLLRSVSVFRWPSCYNYYERFSADADRYFNRAAQECPFVNFFAYLPQYSEMSQDQLRWYLYWRDNVRHGVYLTTDYSYIFLYIYEIINLTEKIPPKQGLDQLCGLWLAYREKFPRLDRYMGEWVCDYCLVNGLPAPLDALAPILPGLVDKLSFKEFYIRYDRTSDCPFTASLCDVLSGYSWRQSKYVTPETKPLFEAHFYPAVLGALKEAWNAPGDFSASLGLAEVGQTRNAYSGALCTYNSKRRIDVRYLSLSRSYQLRFFLTDLYKMAENGIRAYLGIKSRLSATGVPEPMKSFVRAYFEENLPSLAQRNRAKTQEEKQAAREEKQRERERTEAEKYSHYYEPETRGISPDAALALEKESWINTEMLVPEEEKAEMKEALPEKEKPAEKETPAVEPDIPESDDPYYNFVMHLSPEYYEALKHVMCGEEPEYRALCASCMMLPDAMADAINELAVTYTDDTALDADGSFWKLSDYYANDIMNAILTREDT